MAGETPLRGRVYGVRMDHIANGAEKRYLVVSNNRRNQALPQVLAARLTTSAKPALPSIVELGDGEVVKGRVCCDDIETIWLDEITRDLGALSAGAMARIDDGLRAALALN
jgi:mRNA interferase MazF